MKKILETKEGITLVALVVTIIVLIILAGISISLMLRNDGILNKSKAASDEYKKQSATEMMNLKITTCQMQSYTEKGELPTLAYLAAYLQNDKETTGDIAYVKMQSQKQSNLDETPYASWDKIYTRLSTYPYEFEINSSLQLASIDGVKVDSIPENDEDSIVSMTKSELNSYIESAINTKLQEYSKATDISSVYATKSQVENIENSEICSTTEKRVGTYLNNKPLYQRTFTGTIGTLNTETIVNSNANNIDKLFLINGCVIKSGYIATLPYSYGGNIFMNVLKNDSNNIVIQYYSTSNTFYEGGTYYLTVQYTKTSD